MAWLGKLLGGTLGFWFGGPLGMIAGIVFGNMFDKSTEMDQREGSDGESHGYNDRYYFRNTGYSRSQMVFFVGAYSMLAKLASADGAVSEQARRKVHEFTVNELNLTGQSYQYAMRIFDEALSQDVRFEDLADQFYENFRNTPQFLNIMMDMFFRVAMVDGRLSANEERLIDYAAKTFRIHESILDSIRRKYNIAVGSSKAYAVLGLQENATEADIKKAYRKLIMEYHPDRVAARGMADEFKEYAAKRFREIQEAYEAICKERNIK